MNGSWSSASSGVVFTDQSDPFTTATVNAFSTYTFTWTVNDGVCLASDSVQVLFNQPLDAANVSAGQDTTLDDAFGLYLNGQLPAGSSGQWFALGGSPTFSDPSDPTTFVNGLNPGTTPLVWTVSNGNCPAVSDTVYILVNGLFIPSGFSPNCDGVNEHFEVTGIDAYPAAHLQVFDRWGVKVYERSAYRNEWDGKSNNGRDLPSDTYFVVLRLNEDVVHNGYVIIKR